MYFFRARSDEGNSTHRELLEGRLHAGTRVLEISSRSDVALGRELSAMFLTVRYDGAPRRVESLYQAAKDFGEGPEESLISKDGFAAKRAAQGRAAAMKGGRQAAGRIHPRRAALAERDGNGVLRPPVGGRRPGAVRRGPAGAAGRMGRLLRPLLQSAPRRRMPGSRGGDAGLVAHGASLTARPSTRAGARKP